MTPTSAALKHPQYAVHDAVEAALKQVFNLEWQPRVVRQVRVHQVGTLEFIDYAIPCFELAKHLQRAPHEIAEQLAEAITARQSNGFICEAVNGYLNFQLNEQYLDNARLTIAHWYEKPTLLHKEKSDTEFVMLGASILGHTTSTELSDVAHSYITSVRAMLGEAQNSTTLVNDYSAEVLARLPQNGEPLPEKRRQQLESEEAKQAIAQLRTEWQGAHKAAVALAETDKYRVVFESDLYEEANKLLDIASTDYKNGIVRDAATGATYYVQDDVAASLRSATGLLYDLAYELVLLDQRLRTAELEGRKIAILAPQKLQSICMDYISFHAQPSAEVVWFDPNISKADILQIEARGHTPQELFTKLANYLEATQLDSLNDRATRKAVLGLIDLPVELSQHITLQQYPAFFDALSQSYELVDASQE